MGRLSLMLVMALVLGAGIVTYSISLSKKYTVENVSGFQEYTSARNIAHTGVNMMLHKIDRSQDRNDTTIVNPLNRGETVWLVQNALAGLCSVSIKLKNPAFLDTVDLTSKSHFMDTSYSMILRLQRFPKPFPTVGGAVTLASDSMAFSMSGTPNIDGRDHLLNGALTATRGTDTVGVMVVSPYESTAVAAYNSKLTGDPSKVSVGVPDDPGNYINEYINGADYTWTSGNYSGNYGTAAAPVIGYVHGSVTLKGSGSFYGVLVVDGAIDMQGTFDMYGLVICVGDSNTVQTSAGTPEIHGGIIATGRHSSFSMKGTADVQYSTAALNIAKYIPKLLAYKVMKWYE